MRTYRNFEEYYAHARGKAEKIIPKVYEEPKEEPKRKAPRKKKGDE